MAGTLKGKSVLVTGAASGIGRTSALMFAREGAKVLVVDLNVQGGKETVEMIKRARGEASFFKADIRKASDVEAMVNKAVELYGRLDCAHNNAGIMGQMCGTLNCTEDDFDNVMDTNVKGVWLCLKYEVPQMLKQGGGAIVNTASKVGISAGIMGVPANPAYTASKHGVVGLTKQAGMDYAKQGVRINAVCPGWVDTPMTRPTTEEETKKQEKEVAAIAPIARKAKTEEIAEAVVWLCSDAASYVVGHAMLVDGGWGAH
jgi:NAD(P)-dependent dehydrogenase (short-subunit alcohol dehydrogenase family)